MQRTARTMTILVFALLCLPFLAFGQERCAGDCSGVGSGIKQVAGPCPDPCDADILAALAKEAKGKARLDACEECIKRADEKCLCADGATKKLVENCANFARRCVYVAGYQYAGACKEIP